MTTYNELAGLRVNYLSSDPTLNSGNEGQVWYNSTSGTLKSLVQLKAWSSASNMANVLGDGAGFGIQSAAARAGGTTATAASTATEEYSGYTWSSGGNLPSLRFQNIGAGTQTAGLSIGGILSPPLSPTNATEEYDGSTWTAGGNLATSRFGGSQAGIQTAALFAGGDDPSPGYLAVTEEYDGSAWTAGGNLGTARRQGLGAGTQTAALSSGGRLGTGEVTNISEEYNGSTWTSGNSMVTARKYLQGFGNQTNAVIGGGNNGTAVVATTEQYDGTIWNTSSASLGTARSGNGSSVNAPANAGVIFGGAGPYTAATEEFNSSINAITNAAWASGGNLSTARAQHGSANAGTQTAGLAFGGFNWSPPGNIISTEEYDGSTWAGGGNLGTATRNLGGAGTQTAGLAFGGFTTAATNVTQEYDGSTWTSGGNCTTGGFLMGNGGGIQTAALKAGGGPAASTQSEEYDGSTWTSGGNLNTTRIDASVDGSQTAGIIVGGDTGPAGTTNAVESYNGTSWTSVTSCLIALQNQGKSGGLSAQTALMTAGGDGPTVSPATAATQEYDGTGWINTANLATARRQLAGGGTKTVGLVFGGTVASAVALTNTEEYTGGTSITTASTLTTS